MRLPLVVCLAALAAPLLSRAQAPAPIRVDVSLVNVGFSVRDEKGEVHAFTRSPQLKVVRNDPFAAHDQLLDVYTDKNMHDMLAYLVTLK